MRELDISVYRILPYALWPWDRLSLKLKGVLWSIFVGVKSGQCVRTEEGKEKWRKRKDKMREGEGEEEGEDIEEREE
jgi:hypothetical protein